MEKILLEFEKVTGNKKDKEFNLENINFALPAGYIMSLVGNNGAGKTTMLDYIINDKKQYDGVIRLSGIDIRENHTKMKNKIGFVSEDNVFFDKFTPEQNAKVLGVFYDEFDEALFMKMMNKMEVPLKSKYGEMSRGEKMKFQLAFAMAHNCELYLLDEVTAGMDPVFRMELYKILQEIVADEKASVLMVSHIEAEVERKTDYAGIMENGKLIKFGESMDVFSE